MNGLETHSIHVASLPPRFRNRYSKIGNQKFSLPCVSLYSATPICRLLFPLIKLLRSSNSLCLWPRLRACEKRSYEEQEKPSNGLIARPLYRALVFMVLDEGAISKHSVSELEGRRIVITSEIVWQTYNIKTVVISKMLAATLYYCGHFQWKKQRVRTSKVPAVLLVRDVTQPPPGVANFAKLRIFMRELVSQNEEESWTLGADCASSLPSMPTSALVSSSELRSLCGSPWIPAHLCLC